MFLLAFKKKKFYAYEDIGVKCEVGPNNPYTFPKTREKRENI